MKFLIRVDRLGSESKYEEFEDQHPEDNKAKVSLSDKANSAYIKAIGAYDATHTVTIFRDGVSLHNSLGTGSGQLKLDDGEPVVATGATSPKQGGFSTAE